MQRIELERPCTLQQHGVEHAFELLLSVVNDHIEKASRVLLINTERTSLITAPANQRVLQAINHPHIRDVISSQTSSLILSQPSDWKMAAYHFLALRTG